MEVNRRQVLAGLGASLGAAAIGCGADGALAPPGVDPDDVDAAPDGPRIDATEPTPVNACTATSTLTPAQLLAGIDTIVVLCMENRSFDHYLGALRLVEGRADIDGLTGVESNPAPGGRSVPVHLLEDYTAADPPHSWASVHAQWNQGANDGFVREHEGPNQADVMGYHVREQLPVTYALADAGAICQRWFCPVLGPTWPNRYFFHCASSGGQQGNLPQFGLPSIWQRLTAAGLVGTNYFHDVAWSLGGLAKLDNVEIERFFEDAAAGNLPPYAMLDPAYLGGGANDDHPDHDIRLGQALIGSVVAALAQSPQWNRSLLVITYDEHGGFYDHVAPPVIGEAFEPELDFRQLGFRVPSLVIGPTVRRGCAIDTVLEHSAVPATVTRRYGLEPLNARLENTADLSVCIDPRRLDDPLPAPSVPAVDVSLRGLRDRQARARSAGLTSHHEIAAAADALARGTRQDRRGETDEVVQRVLRWGERLGAVRLRD